ncbi:MAG TPA: hypothetical protein VFS75_00725 [Candidatus Paceibacterota bacterium]|nr:hypothetical protein [Candidatus Paceibacterota bacterium]
MKEENGGGPLRQFGEANMLPAHKLEPDDTSHLSDRRRLRSLQSPSSELRIGGVPLKESA